MSSIAVYDIYIYKSSGELLLAGCTGTDYCNRHDNVHELHTGFMAAMNIFIKEVFAEEPKTLLLSNIQINMKTEKGICIAMVHPITTSNELIVKVLTLTLKKFTEMFGVKLDKYSTNEIFDRFHPVLVELGLIQAKLENTLEGQKTHIVPKLIPILR